MPFRAAAAQMERRRGMGIVSLALAVACGAAAPGTPPASAPLAEGGDAHSNPDGSDEAAPDGNADAGPVLAVPDGGTTGGTCTINADCADSAAAQAIQNVRCIGAELYCLQGQCHGDCADSCTAVRTDVNPCPAPRVCAPSMSVCKIIPIKCQTASNCPKYLPPTADGGIAAWVCEGGICAYPGFQYATQ